MSFSIFSRLEVSAANVFNRNRFAHRLFLLAAAGSLLLTGCESNDAGSGRPYVAGAAVGNGGLENGMYHRVNAYRASRGLPALRWNEDMAKLARSHSQAMASRNKLSHDGFYGRAAKLRGRGFSTSRENVAYNKGTSDPIQFAIDGWIDSRGHHKNMTFRHDTHTGVGTARSAEGYTFFTQLYAQ